jgi:hypothetical protein
MNKLAEVLRIKTEEVSMSDIEERLNRGRELYNRELKKGVELGRKLGAFESRYGKLRSHITDVCATLVLKGKFDPNDSGVLAFRNAVRIMKGKNKL